MYPKPLVCDQCGKDGHFATECPLEKAAKPPEIPLSAEVHLCDIQDIWCAGVAVTAAQGQCTNVLVITSDSNR